MDKKSAPSKRLGTVGGQAVLEGVMMRHGERYSVSVRKEDGSIVTENREFISVRKKLKLLNIPLLRGAVNFIEMLMLSYKTLSISAEAYGITEEDEESKFERWLRERFGKGIVDVVMAVSMVLGLALGVGIFLFLPSVLTKATDSALGGALGWSKNLIEGLMKIVIFIAYLWLVSLMPDIRRTFEYHGAEHKSIFCYEAGVELTPENAARYKRFHPRCGTSFMFVMIAISILINSLPFVPWDNMVLRMIIKLALLPFVIGLGYEFLMYAGKHDNLLVRILSAPGLWMQRITTREPDEQQLAVAIEALKSCMPEEFPEHAAKQAAEAEEKSGGQEYTETRTSEDGGAAVAASASEAATAVSEAESANSEAEAAVSEAEKTSDSDECPDDSKASGLGSEELPADAEGATETAEPAAHGSADTDTGEPAEGDRP